MQRAGGWRAGLQSWGREGSTEGVDPRIKEGRKWHGYGLDLGPASKPWYCQVLVDDLEQVASFLCALGLLTCKRRSNERLRGTQGVFCVSCPMAGPVVFQIILD